MVLELTVYELGKALKKIEEKYKLDVLAKLNLSGGWMTIKGKAMIEKIPIITRTRCSGKGNNIMDIRVRDENTKEGIILKITGDKNKKFNVDISSSRYKEVNRKNLSIDEIKVNGNESKLRIDEDIIFTINAPVDEVTTLIEKNN